jgi:hypothetical protein
MPVRRWVSHGLIAAMLATSVPVTADQFTIRCESNFWNRRRYCPADTDGEVRLVREFSRGRCGQWRSWGFDRHGVWVDNGCDAEFRVGRDGGIGAAGGALIGAGIGAAITALILANKDKDDDADEPKSPPNWATGTFHGFSPAENRDYDLTVDRSGRVTGRSERDPIEGHLTKDRLHLGEAEFKIKEESWGFSAVQRDQDSNVIYFRRTKK